MQRFAQRLRAAGSLTPSAATTTTTSRSSSLLLARPSNLFSACRSTRSAGNAQVCRHLHQTRRQLEQSNKPGQASQQQKQAAHSHQASNQESKQQQKQPIDDDQQQQPPPPTVPPLTAQYSHFDNYPRSLRELATRAAAAGQSSSLAAQAKQQQQHQQHDQTHGWTRPKAPSKEDLLRYARGFWTRARIRFKWFTIRGFRRFNADDLSAFFTLGGLGTVIFVAVGTTTFVSLVFAALNALNLQEWIARRIADYLTSETGVTVIFESAIVPKWSSSRISFQNVFISRRAHGGSPDALRLERQHRAARQGGSSSNSKGRKPRTAAAAGQGMAWEGTHWTERDDEEDAVLSQHEGMAPPMSQHARGEEEQDNYTMFDLNVDSIDVTLSFGRWWDGKGLIEDAVVKGVRGIVDRRNVHWDPDKPYDPRAARRIARTGDFDLSSLQLEDFLVTVYQPGDFRPFNFSIFSVSIPRLRKQWLFYDLLGADSITGQIDGCLFSLHKPQRVGRSTEKDQQSTGKAWRTLSRVRIDGVNFDHIQNQSGLHGPVSWITSGKFDVVADMKFPRDLSGDVDINAILTELVENLTHAVSGEPWDRGPGGSGLDEHIPGQHRLSGPAIEAPVTAVGPAAEEAWRQQLAEREQVREAESNARAERRRRRFRRSKSAETDVAQSHEAVDSEAVESEAAQEEAGAVKTEKESSPSTADQRRLPNPSVVIDLDVRFRDIKAAVPLFHSELGYRTQTFVRPIVAFMNANRTLIPVHCRVVVDLSEFDGSMDMAQTGLLPLISEKIYEALANHVTSQQANGQRIRNVSSWSLKVAAHAILQLATAVRDGVTRTPAQPKTEAL